MVKSKWLPIIIFGSAHISIIALLFNSGVYDDGYSSAGLFFDYASRTFQGQLAYRDFSMEYPPLALLFFLLPRLVASDINTYAAAFAVEILLFDLMGLFIIAAMSRRLDVSPWVTLGVYTLALLAIGPITAGRYDLIPATMVLLALYTFSLGKQKLSWAILALGTMTKIYPVVLVPIFLIDSWGSRQYREGLHGVIAFTATVAVIILPFLWLSPEHFWDFFGYHIQRGLQLESLYASFLLVGHNLGLTTAQLEFGFGAWNIISPPADTLAKISTVLALLSLFTVYWRFYNNRSHITQPRISDMVNHSLLAILAFVVTCKVFSPQFIIWLYPLIPLVAGRWRHISWILFLIIGLTTYYIFPTHYIELMAFAPTAIYVLLGRNLLLLALTCLRLASTDYVVSAERSN